MAKVLFDSCSYLKENAEEHVQEFLECTDQSESDFSSHSNLLDAVVDWLAGNVEFDWEDFKNHAKDEKPTHCLVTGYFMSWMGKQAGGKVYRDLHTAVTSIVMEDSHPIFSLTDEGVLVLDETHHDAPVNGNHYEFRMLTAAGKKYYEIHHADDPRTLHEALKEKGRTRNVDFKIFGFSKKGDLL